MKNLSLFNPKFYFILLGAILTKNTATKFWLFCECSLLAYASEFIFFIYPGGMFLQKGFYFRTLDTQNKCKNTRQFDVHQNTFISCLVPRKYETPHLVCIVYQKYTRKLFVQPIVNSIN